MKEQTKSDLFSTAPAEVGKREDRTWWLTGQSFMGIAGIAIAAILIFAPGSFWQWTPLLLLLFAVWQLVSNGFRYWLGPALIAFVAIVAQLWFLDVIDSGGVGVLWPLLLIGAGVTLLLRKTTAAHAGEKRSGDRFDIVAIFGGAGRQITSQAFTGGSATIVCGGAEIDLREMQIADRPAEINVFILCGGIGIKASPDTLISTEVIAIFGGSGDDRRQRKMLPGEGPEIVIRGVALFGGIGIEG